MSQIIEAKRVVTARGLRQSRSIAAQLNHEDESRRLKAALQLYLSVQPSERPSVNSVAREFGVSRRTLERRIQDGKMGLVSPGAPPALPASVEAIIGITCALQQAVGHCIKPCEVKRRASISCVLLARETTQPPRDTKKFTMSNDWMRGVWRRHASAAHCTYKLNPIDGLSKCNQLGPEGSGKLAENRR